MSYEFRTTVLKVLASIFLRERLRGAQFNENSSDLSDAPDVRAARPLGPFTPNVGGTRRTSSPTKHRSCALARSGSTSPPCRDRVLHVAAFGYALLEIVPSSLSRGNPATRWFVGYALIASARHVLASSALIGAALFECGVVAVSADSADPASATAMSGPRVLINLKPDLKTLMEPIPAPRIARLGKK